MTFNGSENSGILPNYRNSSLNFFRFLLTDLIEKKKLISEKWALGLKGAGGGRGTVRE